MKEELCPCCERHCSLEEPHCSRGAEYAETGETPHAHACDVRKTERQRRYRSLNPDQKLISNIRDMGHTVRALSEGKASQSRILILLNESKTVTQSELTERLGVQPGTASEVIGKLERAGLLERRSSDRDRRTCELKLTESGMGRAAEAGEERKIRYREMFACLTESEKSQLLALLEKVNEDWQKRYGDRKPASFHGGGEHGCHHGEHGRRHGQHGRHTEE